VKFPIDGLAFPLFPGLAHSAPLPDYHLRLRYCIRAARPGIRPGRKTAAHVPDFNAIKIRIKGPETGRTA
jgi:hypothetical protein